MMVNKKISKLGRKYKFFKSVFLKSIPKLSRIRQLIIYKNFSSKNASSNVWYFFSDQIKRMKRVVRISVVKKIYFRRESMKRGLKSHRTERDGVRRQNVNFLIRRQYFSVFDSCSAIPKIGVLSSNHIAFRSMGL